MRDDRMLIGHWQKELGIESWNIATERIFADQIDYNGEDYFIGISRDCSKKEATIHHDVDLYEEAIVHELLHIRYPLKSEEEVDTLTAYLLNKQIKTTKK